MDGTRMARALPRRMRLALLAAACCLASPAWAGEFELLSEADSQREQQTLADANAAAPARMPSVRTRAILPAIKVVSPQLGSGALKSPLRIELQFEPAGDTRIDVKSFRILYGVLRIDLTEKIRANARITEHGLLAEAARIPRGDHRLILQIADEYGRQAETELRFRVDE